MNNEKQIIEWIKNHQQFKSPFFEHCGVCGVDIASISTPTSIIKNRAMMNEDGSILFAFSICPNCENKTERIQATMAAIAEQYFGVQIVNGMIVKNDPEKEWREHERGQLIRQIQTEPWTAEGIRRAQRLQQAGQHWVLHTPADVFADRLLAASCLLNENVERIGDRVSVPLIQKILMMTLLRTATPVLWDNAITSEAYDMSVPDCKWSCDWIDPPIQYWTWQTDRASEDGKYISQGLLVVDSTILNQFHNQMYDVMKRKNYEDEEIDFLRDNAPQRYTEIIEISCLTKSSAVRPHSDTVFVNHSSLLDGAEFPNAFNWSNDSFAWARHMFALTAFMNSPWIPKEDIGPPRAFRKEAEKRARKAGEPVPQFPKARFLTLRKIRKAAGHEEAHEAIGADTEAGRVYTRSWLRSGHIRAQRYGKGNSLIKPVYIAPTICKPELPYIPRAERVHR